MLIKNRDATQTQIQQLEREEIREQDPVNRIRLQQTLGRLRANTTSEFACDFLNHHFADSEDWLLLHDVRLEVESRQAVANHILIDRGMRFYWLDTRYIDCGLSVHANGACTAHRAGRNKIHSASIASPLNKLQKDLRMFSSIVRKLQTGIGWSGLIKTPIIKGFILTNPSIKNVVPRDCAVDSSPIVSRDSLFPLIWKSREGEYGFWSRDSSDHYFNCMAASMLEQHRPLVNSDLLPDTTEVGHITGKPSDSAHCYYCGGGVAVDEREHSFRNMDVYGGRVVCLRCQNVAEPRSQSMRAEYQR